MGMLDQEIMLADGQPVTANGDTPSINIYDCGGPNGQGDNGLTGEGLWFTVRARTAFSSGSGAGTAQAVLQDSADGTAFADVLSGPAAAVTGIVAGYELLRTQPPLKMRRYWRAVIRAGGGATLNSGTFDAYVANNVQHNVARQSGFTVS